MFTIFSRSEPTRTLPQQPTSWLSLSLRAYPAICQLPATPLHRCIAATLTACIHWHQPRAYLHINVKKKL